MRWIKKGHIFKPSGEYEWMSEFAQVPTPIELEDRLRIFFATRCLPENNLYKSVSAFIDVDKTKPHKILSYCNEPILGQSTLGTFDEFGIMPGSFIMIQDKLYMYYTGWSREYSVPYTTSIGLAISHNLGKSFTRISNGPIISKSINDPFLVNGPYVVKIESTYYMWYSSAYTWLNIADRKDPIYKIKYAISTDGINWVTSDNFIIEEKISNEAQNAPCVFLYNDKYFMIFCYRESINFRNNTNGYKLGLAVSENLDNWNRIQDPELVGIELNWDKYMKAYPRVIKLRNKYILFYNGNFFGKDGFGYAELEI